MQWPKDDTDISTDADRDSEVDYVLERKAICFESKILELARLNVSKVCTHAQCRADVGISTRYVGTATQLKWVCSKGHIVKIWNSQPVIKQVYVGDLLLSSAILTSGNNYAKILLLTKFMNLGCVSSSSNHRFQRAFIIPEINRYFGDLMAENRERHKGKDVVLSGDGRNDSPGHCAMYCTYTVTENETKDILGCQIVDKRMTDLKSTNMEKKGLIMVLDELIADGLNITELTTDAHTQIAAMLRTDYPTIFHSWDVWHGAKNFGKKLTALAQESRNSDLRPWIPDIINHFWFCSKKAEGDESALLDRWRGVLHHTTDVHQWLLSDSSVVPECEHGELTNINKKWLEPDTDAHTALTKAVLDTRFVHTLKHYVNFRHTGELENFHQHLLMYASKRFSYGFPMYTARNQLAVIDYQKHKDRPQAVDAKGELRYARLYSKRTNAWSAVAVKEPKMYTYIPAMLQNILKNMEVSKGPIPLTFPLQTGDPRLIKRNIGAAESVATKDLVEKKKSRFE